MKTQTTTTQIATGSVFPYVRASDRDLALVARAAGGVFICGPNAAHVAAGVVNLGVQAIADPAFYEKEGRTVFAGRRWAASQANSAQSMLLTPSPYVGREDVETLRGITREAKAAHELDERVVAVLPMASSWLRDPFLSQLVRQVDTLDVPIAIVLANSHNPVAAEATVRGLIRLVEAKPDMIMLRTDIAALGAIAHGARAAGIGIRSSLRHLYRSKGGPSHPDPSPSAFAIQLCDFHRASRYALTRGADSHGILDCPCRICEGRSLSRLDAPGSETEANHHSVAAWLEVAQAIMSTPVTYRIAQWQEICEKAIAAHSRLTASTRIAFKPNSPLSAWASYPSRRPALS